MTFSTSSPLAVMGNSGQLFVELVKSSSGNAGFAASFLTYAGACVLFASCANLLPSVMTHFLVFFVPAAAGGIPQLTPTVPAATVVVPAQQYYYATIIGAAPAYSVTARLISSSASLAFYEGYVRPSFSSGWSDCCCYIFTFFCTSLCLTIDFLCACVRCSIRTSAPTLTSYVDPIAMPCKLICDTSQISCRSTWLPFEIKGSDT
jgi:hypothetical protein